MFITKGDKIIISKGDTFDVPFTLQCYQLKKDDEIIFTIKKTVIDDKVLIQKSYSGLEGNYVRVRIPADEMAALEVGKYTYDLVCLSSGIKITLNFPATLIIKGVIHNEQ